ncbi:MAG: hypothetical protein KJ065_07495 [Anaerolineae bacterium]|nr:hypothetical protein [Anaerolineae bacterium]
MTDGVPPDDERDLPDDSGSGVGADEDSSSTDPDVRDAVRDAEEVEERLEPARRSRRRIISVSDSSSDDESFVTARDSFSDSDDEGFATARDSLSDLDVVGPQIGGGGGPPPGGSANAVAINRLLAKGFTGRLATEFVNLLLILGLFVTLFQASDAVGQSVALLVIGIVSGGLLAIVSISGMTLSLRGAKITESGGYEIDPTQPEKRDWWAGLIFFGNTVAGLFTVTATIALYANSNSYIAIILLLIAAGFVLLYEGVDWIRLYIGSFVKWVRAGRPASVTPKQKRERWIWIARSIFGLFKLVAAALFVASSVMTVRTADSLQGNQPLVDATTQEQCQTPENDQARQICSDKTAAGNLSIAALAIGGTGYLVLGILAYLKDIGITNKLRRTERRTGVLAALNDEVPSLWIGSYSRVLGEVLKILAFMSIMFVFLGVGRDTGSATRTDNELIAQTFALTFGGLYLLAGIWQIIGSLYRFGIQNEPVTGTAWFITGLVKFIVSSGIITGALIVLVRHDEVTYPLSTDPATMSGWLNQALRMATVAWLIVEGLAFVLELIRFVMNIYAARLGAGLSRLVLLIDTAIPLLRALALAAIVGELFTNPPRPDNDDMVITVIVLFGFASLLNLIYGIFLDQESVLRKRWQLRVQLVNAQNAVAVPAPVRDEAEIVEEIREVRTRSAKLVRIERRLSSELVQSRVRRGGTIEMVEIRQENRPD